MSNGYLSPDPDIHYVGKRAKDFDVGLLEIYRKASKELLTAIKSKYKTLILQGRSLSTRGIYAKSKIVFNISIRNTNMRV
jgi:hypothetical protein